MESAAVAAVEQPGALVYAFGARWGPEKTTKDKYFQFLPGNGIHNIHMNQGNDKKHVRDDGVYHDGSLIFEYPNGKYRGFFLAFSRRLSTRMTRRVTRFPLAARLVSNRRRRVAKGHPKRQAETKGGLHHSTIFLANRRWQRDR